MAYLLYTRHTDSVTIIVCSTLKSISDVSILQYGASAAACFWIFWCVNFVFKSINKVAVGFALVLVDCFRNRYDPYPVALKQNMKRNIMQKQSRIWSGCCLYV